MSEYHTIHKIFLDIHTFIIEYVKLIKSIYENSNKINKNIITIKLDKEDFYLPFTFNNYSQRINELQHRLQNQIRILAQKRRHNISKGIDIDNVNILIDNQKETYRFNDDFKNDLEQFQNNISNKNIIKMIRYIRAIIDAFEFYDEIQTEKYFFDITFRLLPIIKHIQKQLCCISTNIQIILDDNTTSIDQHLRRLQQKLISYEKYMRNQLAKYISRDIRPPVLVIPYPTHQYSPEIFSQMKSSNAFIDENNSDDDLVQITNVSSEDSLSIVEEITTK